eukprot:5175257-Pleurochrysis_carterae.AAC.1
MTELLRINAPPCGTSGEALTIGILALAITFPTIEIDEQAKRVIAYMEEKRRGRQVQAGRKS